MSSLEQFQNLNDNPKLIEEISRYRKLVAEDPKNHEFRYNLGILQSKIKDYESAIKAYKEALELKPSYFDALYNQAFCYYQLGFFDRATAAYEDCLKLKDDDEDVLFNLGAIAQQRNDHENALIFFEKLVETNPENHRALDQLSYIYFLDGDHEKAEECSQKAVELETENHVYLNRLGLILQSLEKYKESKNRLEKATMLNEDDAEAWNNLGNTLVQLGEYDESEKAYLKALNLEPENEIFIFNLGELFFVAGDRVKAIPLFKRVLETQKNDAEAHYYLAQCHEEHSPKQAGVLYDVLFENNHRRDLPFLRNYASLARRIFSNKEVKIRTEIEKIAPLDNENNFSLAELYLYEENFEKAFTQIRKCRDNAIEYLLIYRPLKIYFFESEQLIKEVECLEKILKINPSEETVFIRLGEIALTKRMPKQAIDYFNRAPDNFEGDEKIWLGLLDQCLEKKLINNAYECAKKLFCHLYYNSGIWSRIVRRFYKNNLLDDFIEEFIVPEFQKRNSLFREILPFRDLLDRLDFFKSSLFFMEKFIVEFPNDVNFLDKLGQSYLRCHKLDEAKKYLDKILEEKDDPKLWNTLAEAYYMEGKLDEAEEVLQKILQSNTDYKAFFIFANILAKREDFKQSVEYYKKSIELYPHEKKTWFNLGLVYEQLDELDNAAEAYHSAIKTNRHYFQAWSALGILNFEAKQLKLAKNKFLRSIAINQKYVHAWNNLAVVFEELGEDEKMEKCIERIEEIDQEVKKKLHIA